MIVWEPERFRDYICLPPECGKDYKFGFTYNEKLNDWVCAGCHKVAPQAFLVGYLHECEACDKEYISERMPDKYKLCTECTAKVPSRPRRKRPEVQ